MNAKLEERLSHTRIKNTDPGMDEFNTCSAEPMQPFDLEKMADVYKELMKNIVDEPIPHWTLDSVSQVIRTPDELVIREVMDVPEDTIEYRFNMTYNKPVHYVVMKIDI